MEQFRDIKSFFYFFVAMLLIIICIVAIYGCDTGWSIAGWDI